MTASALAIEATAKFGRDDEGVRRAAQWLLQSGPKAAPLRKAKGRMIDHEERIVKWLVIQDIDPMAVPVAPLGNKPWALRLRMMADLGLTEPQWRKAWTSLREDPARVQDA